MGLREYIKRRTLQVIFIYFVFLSLLWLLFRFAPGDPTILYLDAGMTPAQRQDMIERLGLDQPLYIQYLDYLGQLLTGDLGISIRHRRPVAEVLLERVGNTVILMLPALIIAYIIGGTLGAFIGWVRGTVSEKVGLVITLILRSSPEFWTGIVLLMLFTFHLGWFPSGGMRTVGVGMPGDLVARYVNADFLRHMALPLATAVLYYMCMPTLVTRSSMIETMNEDFITIKKAEGISEFNILFKHATMNSILPLITLAAILTGRVVGGALVIETVFSWPGMGREMVLAVHHNDYPMATATFFVMGSVVIFANFIADILYSFIDPRVVYE